MPNNIWKGIIIISILLLLLIHPQSRAGGEPEEPELIIESEFRFLFGNGGGTIKVTVQGDLAQEIRKDIIDDYLNSTSSDELITEEISDLYSEAIEDILELNIATQNIWRDYEPSVAGVEYEGYYKIMKFDPKINCVDVRSINGLIGTNRDDRSKFTIKIDVKETPVENRALILSDGYIMLYALWGDEIPSFNIKVEERCNIITIGMESYSDPKLENGGEITHYRLLMGEFIEYKHTYELNGYALVKNADTIKFESLNILENALILFILIIIFTSIPSIISRSITKRYRMKKVSQLKIIGIIFFIILLIIYFMGILGLGVLGLTFMFFIVNLILIIGVYRRGWGNLVKIKFNRDDFLKEPPKIEQGPWHERGIANAKVGNFKEAANCFEMALETEPENATIWNDLGFVLRKSGNYRTAIDCFEKALEIRPDYKTAMENLEKAKLEMALIKKQKKRRSKR